MILYVDRFWISPYVFSCFVALREKGIAFETRDVGLDRGDQKTDDYRARSITGRVPSLTDGDFSLAESQAIVEYLEDVQPTPPILPHDSKERARARQLLAWIRSDLDALRAERPTTTMFYESGAGEGERHNLPAAKGRRRHENRQDVQKADRHLLELRIADGDENDQCAGNDIYQSAPQLSKGQVVLERISQSGTCCHHVCVTPAVPMLLY